MYHNNLVHAKVSNFYCVLKIVVSWKMYNSWLEIKETYLGINLLTKVSRNLSQEYLVLSFESG